MKVKYYMPIQKFRKALGTVAAIVLLGLFSCDHGSQLGNYLVQPSTRTIMVDTFSVQASVLAKDSIVTSGKNLVFAGTYDDPWIGRSTASSFIEFSRTSDNETNEYYRVDSIALVLNPTGLYYGDTIPRPAFKISRLASKIEMDDNGYRYSCSQAWPTAEEIPTNRNFRWRMYEKMLYLRLPDELGEQLMQGIIKKDDEYNSENFLDTFSGLAIEPTADSKCIYAFSISDSTCQIVIYYHLPGSDNYADKTMTFKANASKQYSTMRTDLLPRYPTGSKSEAVPTANTGNMGVVMSGPTGLYTRLDFPTIDRLKNYGEFVLIQQARLIVRPVRHSYDTVPIPQGVTLYTINPNSNERTSTPAIGATSSGTTNSTEPTFNTDGNRLIHENNFFTFDITDFIAGQVGAADINKLSISVEMPDGWTSSPPDSTTYPFQRMFFGNQSFLYQNKDVGSSDCRVSLEITYSIYNEYQP